MQLFTNIQDELIAQINEAKDSLKIAVTWFTNHDLFNAIIKKIDNPEFKVSLIVLNDRINNKREGVNFQELINKKGCFYYSGTQNMVHHKFCIIDDKTVITGSYNWTYYAENRNWENIVVLNDSEIVKAYIEEFEKVIQSHEQVDNISAKQKMDFGINSNEYLTTDYILQAKKEEQQGNDLAVAKIYTELLRLNNKQPEIQKARTTIVQKINNQRFETCPFEIGIHFKNGYSMVIPAFAPLPITVKINGTTPVSNATSLQVTIQKYDYIHQNILQFTLDNLKIALAGTPKIEHTITIDQTGIMTVHCLELNGYGRTKVMKTDIKKFQ
ncbi:phospholipase D-like domain-containing protein [Flavobacterium sp. HNIBRBA15423]|uniref:phospholipase D-like domain-containing protein n=1 Tax=Flavobacterium sp. HNIBRBA15423 TaxID=3458683 RepID=UPI0040443E9E